MKESTGWLLLILGVMLILWGVYYSYQIFTDKVSPPQMFKTSEEEVFSGSAETPQEQMEVAIKDHLESVISAETIPKIFNLIAWSMFAIILFMGASHIAVLGIRLIK